MMRALRRRDDGVTEVIGYVLSFALSAIFLLLALNIFWAARTNTEDVTTGVELKTLSDRIAARIVELGTISQEFPNSTMSVAINIPQMLNGQIYSLTASPESVVATTHDGLLTAESTTFKVDVLSVAVSGDVDSSNEVVIVRYADDAITISGE